LLAGAFEPQFATASGWRWFAAILLLAASITLTLRDKLAPLFSSILEEPQGQMPVGISELRVVLFFSHARAIDHIDAGADGG